MYKKVSIFAFVTMAALVSFTWPEKLEKKVQNTIEKTFGTSDFQLESIVVSKDDEWSKMINGNLFYITTNDGKIGAVFVDEAPSMKNVFDYAIIFTPDFVITNAKVLIYRENHGRQIGMKRWLQQFFGLKPGDKPILGSNIDGISGATISANSMTKAVNEVLTAIDELKQNGQIK